MRFIIDALTSGTLFLVLSLNCGGTMGTNETPNQCGKLLSAIADREYRDWKGLPASCDYSMLDVALARLRDEYGQGGLGSAQVRTMFRMHVAENYGHNLKIWFREEHVVLVEIRYPALPYSAQDLIRQLGEPEAKLDYFLEVMQVSKGAWVYPRRGITLFLDAGRSEIMRIGLFHPCSLSEYLERIDPNAEMHELPTRE